MSERKHLQSQLDEALSKYEDATTHVHTLLKVVVLKFTKVHHILIRTAIQVSEKLTLERDKLLAKANLTANSAMQVCSVYIVVTYIINMCIP